MILYIIIILLIVVITILALALLIFIRKSFYLDNKEKDYIFFVIDIFKDYSDELGIHSKEQHKELVKELEKIKIKLNKNETKIKNP